MVNLFLFFSFISRFANLVQRIYLTSIGLNVQKTEKLQIPAIIKGLIGEAEALTKLNHKSLKGHATRTFCFIDYFPNFLQCNMVLDQGVIINQLGMQSKQIDIIIYGRRILPPFIEEQKIGLYPAECVLATIEIRSIVTKSIIKKYAESTKFIHEQLYDKECSHYRDYDKLRPLCSLVGFL